MSTHQTAEDFTALREEMVDRQMAQRGLRDADVLEAVRTVPREVFVPEELAEFAYEDAPLPIGEGQTISQPYIVALMAERLELDRTDRVLDVGTGSGYAAAVLSRIVDEVYTIERHGRLAETARERFRALGYDNIHVRQGDGTLGWPKAAPFDAIVVAAAGPDVPEPLLEQLAIGGRLIIPTGTSPRLQKLRRVRRVSADEYQYENLGRVQFVPLIGAAGWRDPSEDDPPATLTSATLPEHIAQAAEPFTAIERADLDALLRRIGDARVVCIGEASHGTDEFYQMRARITQALIEQKGFTLVTAEADWPDAARVNHYVQGTPPQGSAERPFTRFPTWMWANTQVLNFVEWLRQYNQSVPQQAQAGFYGLDLYSLHTSIASILQYLEDVDPETARIARERYGCLTPWAGDPATYGAAALTGRYRGCEEEVVAMLQDLLNKHLTYAQRDGQRSFDALQNARLVANAERYYRVMYYGGNASWNLRDEHMFETLQALLDFHGPDAKAVVWAHNSHLGDASATEMGAHGQLNVGQLCRDTYGTDAYLIGFGTDHGTVAAASDWNGPMEVKQVRSAHAESYERLCHETDLDAFLLPLRYTSQHELREVLMEERLERAIGVIYRPQTELQSHYFRASLPHQFDEYIWFDETRAVTPLGPEHTAGVPETFPFGV